MTRLGLTASANSLVIPLRSSVPGAEDSVRNLPQLHQELDPASVLEVEAHRQLVLGDLRLVAAVGPRGSGVNCGAVKRNTSPPGRSVWMTSAPNSASFVPIYGCAISTPVPTARIPSSGPKAGTTHGVPGRFRFLIQSGMAGFKSSIVSSCLISRGSCAMILVCLLFVLPRELRPARDIGSQDSGPTSRWRWSTPS